MATFAIVRTNGYGFAGVAELVDAQDLKSWDRMIVGVRFPPPAPPSTSKSGEVDSPAREYIHALLSWLTTSSSSFIRPLMTRPCRHTWRAIYKNWHCSGTSFPASTYLRRADSLGRNNKAQAEPANVHVTTRLLQNYEAAGTPS